VPVPRKVIFIGKNAAQGGPVQLRPYRDAFNEKIRLVKDVRELFFTSGKQTPGVALPGAAGASNEYMICQIVLIS
jgi:hypothetical protein